MSDGRAGGPPAKPRKPRGPALNIALFAITLLTTFLAGMLFLYARTWGEALSNGLQYMAALMGILVAHEAGHFVMARRNRVPASLPYFIPLPPNISIYGTMGAVIVMRGRIRSRDALMEVGAAGPLAGMAVALPLLIVGLAGIPVGPIPEGGWMEGQSLLYILAKRLVVGPIPEGHDIYLDQAPLVWAAWIGMLVTMINLFPIGQLDGGHIAYALFGRAHQHISRLFHGGLFVYGISLMAYRVQQAIAAGHGIGGETFWARVMPAATWPFLGVLLLVLGVVTKSRNRHPPTDDEHLSPRHRVIGYLCIALLIMTFMPIVMEPVV